MQKALNARLMNWDYSAANKELLSTSEQESDLIRVVF